MADSKPSAKYPDLTDERLAIVAGILRGVRDGAVLLHDPNAGDGIWSLSCRIYDRSCNRLRDASTRYEWLRIIPEPEKPLRFSFRVGATPLRFYSGKADDPPSRYSFKIFPELHEQQMLLDMGSLPPLDTIIRIAIEPDSTQNTATVTLVEMNLAGDVTDTWVVPQSLVSSNLTTIQTPAVDLPAVTVEPLKSEEERDKKENGISLVSK